MHRTNIGYEVEVILDGYWQNRPSDTVKAGILADWMDELQDWGQDQIRWALREWRKKNPSKKPNPGHISMLLKYERGRTFVAQREGKEVRELFKVESPVMLGAAE